MVTYFSLVGKPEQIEYLGTKRKFWYQDSKGRSTLFKEGRPNTGENWAEVVAYELSKLLGIPAAEYSFSRWQERDDAESVLGVSTVNLVPQGARLIHGNELLFGVDPKYPRDRRYKINSHTVGRVFDVLSHIKPLPPDGSSEEFNAYEYFCSYLMLDALIGNTDRHHENWGIILGTDGNRYLAPTFDHASSLGRELTDTARQFKLTTKDVNQSVVSYVSKNRSGFNATDANNIRINCLDAAREALELCPTGIHWVEKICSLEPKEIDNIFQSISSEWMSDYSKVFAQRLLEENVKGLRTFL